MNPLSAQPTPRELCGERGVPKAIPIAELAETVRFAMKATGELNLSGFKQGKEEVARLGAELGHEIARNLLAGAKHGINSRLESFFKKSGLGVMTLIQADPIVISLSDPKEHGASGGGHLGGTHAFKKSLLEAIFQDMVAPMMVVESESGADGRTEWMNRSKTG